MKPSVYRRPHQGLIILVCCLVLFIISLGSFLSIFVEHELERNILLLHGSTSSVRVNLFTRSIKVTDLEWSSGPNSINLNPHFLRLSAVTAEGINLYELFAHKTLLIKDITIDSGTVQYSRHIIRQVQKIRNSEYNHFLFKNISLKNIHTQVKTDTTTSLSALLNGRIGELSIKIDSLHTLSYSVEGVDALVEHLSISRTEGMYGGTVARIRVNTLEKKLIIDSAILIPNYGKYEFAHQAGEQIARMDLSIPHIIIDGLQYEKLMDASFIAASIKIKSFDLYSFKDKRIPFLRKKNIPLPMAGFIHLPFSVKVDSISIEDSHIHVEEFPEFGNTIGIITFDSIRASITHLNNRRKETDPTTARFDVTALLLNQGRIKANFQFPLDGSPLYSATGSISKMNLKTLNPVLSALGNVRVESGYLNALSFQFKYTDYFSKGTLNIDYSDLQLMSLDDHHRATDGFKTFLMNAFVKNKRSQSPLSNVQTARIEVERDRKRYIFNIWIKSIMDGLKSSVLGKTTPSRGKKKEKSS